MHPLAMTVDDYQNKSSAKETKKEVTRPFRMTSIVVMWPYTNYRSAATFRRGQALQVSFLDAEVGRFRRTSHDMP